MFWCDDAFCGYKFSVSFAEPIAMLFHFYFQTRSTQKEQTANIVIPIDFDYSLRLIKMIARLKLDFIRLNINKKQGVSLGKHSTKR